MNRSNDKQRRTYWLIEPDDFDNLPILVCLRPFKWAFLSWIAERVEVALELEKHGIFLTVIDAEYVNKYPCLAAYSAAQDRKGYSIIPDEIANEILREINLTISKTTVSEMLAQVPWGDAEAS